MSQQDVRAFAEKDAQQIEELATQMLDWVDENVGLLNDPQAEGLKTEFKRLLGLFEAQQMADKEPVPRQERQEPFTTPQPTITD
jgi:hypothetical protein